MCAAWFKLVSSLGPLHSESEFLSVVVFLFCIVLGFVVLLSKWASTVALCILQF